MDAWKDAGLGVDEVIGVICDQGGASFVVSRCGFPQFVGCGIDPDDIVDVVKECKCIHDIATNRGSLETMGVSPFKLTDESLDDWY